MDEASLGARQGAVSSEPRQRRRWPFVVSTVVLFLAAAGLGGAFTYSTYSAQEWREAAARSDKALVAMTKQRDEQKVQIDELKSQAGDLRSQVGNVTAEYETATGRIRSLSDEKAQTGDQAAYYATLVAMSQNVTEGMDVCIDNLQQLQTYLVNFDSYDATALINYAREINTGCDQARADSEALSRKLAG